MASTSIGSANSYIPSSSNRYPPKYDVFLSFSGEDVRHNFVEYVYRALRQKGILTFKDDDKLKDGEDVKGGLYESIEDSAFSIVILSVNYASSSWCLDELVRILHCKRTVGHVVYPVFYHVTPSEVRKREGEFGKGFAKAAVANKGKVKKWTEALKQVSNLKGWVYPHKRFENEATLIDNLVHKIFIRTIDTYPIPAEGLVGIRSRMVEVIKLLDLGSDETRAVGLWGMGGIGKTTLAKVVYDSISWQFEGCSFIDDVTDLLNNSGELALQEHLISDILNEEKIDVRSVMRGKSIIQNMVCRKKVLIVLDNVSEQKQLENLVVEPHLFSPGSRIIITTRNQHVLTVRGIQNEDVYNVQELKKHEATELFKTKAFAKNGETEEFRRLIDSAVQYAKGVPLALKVLGSLLLGGTAPEWECALDRLRKSPDDEVQRVLRISYDGLHWTEKEIFLDIACFFRGMYKGPVIKILNSCGFNSVSGINFLVKKSLLTISVDNKLGMHDLIQMMGWSIVDEESRKEPGERSRVWRPDDIKNILLDNTGTKKVEGILFYPKNIQPRPEAFAKMTNLRILMIIGSWCSIDLPNKLRLLRWHGCPMKCLPSTFKPEHLVELRLTNSNIEQLWDGKVVLPKLTLIDLGHSTSLNKAPDFSGFFNLEDLIFEGCTALLDLHPSIKNLTRLKILNLKGCSSLHSLPYGIESQCLQALIFSGCLKLSNILNSFKDLKQLELLDLDGTLTTELPHTIGNSTNLYHLDLSDCTSLKSIPRSIGQLKKLKKLLLNGCSSLSNLPDEVGLLDSLEILDVSFSGLTPLADSNVPCNTSINIDQLNTIRKCTLNGCYSLNELGLVHDLECIDVTFPDAMPVSASSQGFSIPSSIGQLKKLKQLLFVGCFNLSKLPEEVGLIDSLEILDVSFSRVRQLPASVNRLRNLKKLEFRGCNRIIPPSFSGFESLTLLDLTLSDLEVIPESISLCFSLKTLLLAENKFMFLPASIKNLSNLEVLFISGCRSLQELPELPSNTKEVMALGCESLKTIYPTMYKDARRLDFTCCPKLVGNEEINLLLGYNFLFNQIKESKHQSARIYSGPGSKIPKWINSQNVGGSIALHLPMHDLNSSNLMGFAFSAVVVTKSRKCSIGVEMRIGEKIFKFGELDRFNAFSKNVIVLFKPTLFFTVDKFHMGGTILEVCFVNHQHSDKKGFYTTDRELKPALEIKKCGVRLIYEEEVVNSGEIVELLTCPRPSQNSSKHKKQRCN